MKTLYTFLLILFVAFGCFAQTKTIDSLREILPNAKSDSTEVLLYLNLFDHYRDIQPDTAVKFGYMAFKSAEKNKNRLYQIGIRQELAYTIGATGNYVKALQLLLESKAMAEEDNDSLSLASAHHYLGNLYKWQKDYRTAIMNYKKAHAYRGGKNPSYTTFMNLGIIYLELNQPDSALLYAQNAYSLSSSKGNQKYQYTVLANLGRIHQRMGNDALARSYLNMAEARAASSNSARAKCFVLMDFSDYFKEKGNRDSSIYYAKQVFAVPGSGVLKPIVLDAAMQLSELYTEANTDSAFKYLKLATVLKEELSGSEKTQQLQALQYEGELAEQKRALEKQELQEERAHNLQYALIAFGLISFVIFFFLFSHSVIADQRLIKFLGVLSLLVFFEFLNLLLHPLLGEITHHQPWMMLSAMVVIAALIIPLHHKLEHWITHRLIEKNKVIRLSAAKKTIEQLEGNYQEKEEVTQR